MNKLSVCLLFACALGLPLAASAQTLEETAAAIDKKDYATAFAGLSKHAEAGNTKAQLMLGLMYLDGLGVTRDSVLAAA